MPAHSFKYAATLQARQGGPAPVLIRIDTKSGHGASNTKKQIESTADVYAFVMHHLGMTPAFAVQEHHVVSQPTRRDAIARTAAGVAGLAALGLPESLWALQDGDEPVTLTDYTDAFKIEASANRAAGALRGPAQAHRLDDAQRRALHLRADLRPDGGRRQLPAAHWRLRRAADGAHARPAEGPRAIAATRRSTLECSGNSTRPQRMSGLLSNGVWTGVGLKSLLEECGMKPEAREVLFLGLDSQTEKKFQAGNREYQAPHGRAISLHRRARPRHDAGLCAERPADPAPSRASRCGCWSPAGTA